MQVHEVLLALVRTAPVDGYRRVLGGHLLQDENPSPSCVRKHKRVRAVRARAAGRVGVRVHAW